MQAVVLYEYTSTEESQLSISPGDILSVSKVDESGWCMGVNTVSGKSGWFPHTYVEIREPEVYNEPPPPLPPNSISNDDLLRGSWGQEFDNDLLVDVELQKFSFDSPSVTSPTSQHIPYSPTTSPRDNTSVRSMRSLTFVNSSNDKPLPDENGRFSYSHNFWADKGEKSGFDILVSKHRNGKEVCKDIAQFIQERVRIEEQYAKAMMELGKSTLADQESGTSRTAINQLKFDICTQAQSRMAFTQRIISTVHKPLIDFKNEQKKMRKNYESTIAQDRKTLLLKFQNVQKNYRVYIARAKEADSAENTLRRSLASNNLNKKELAKIEENAKKERKKASVAAYDYKTACDEYEAVRMQWEEDMSTACDEFQHAEEDRITYLKKALENYLLAQKEVNSSCKESGEMVESSVDSVSPEIDIELFVKSSFTGAQRPVQVRFEQYKGYNA